MVVVARGGEGGVGWAMLACIQFGISYRLRGLSWHDVYRLRDNAKVCRHMLRLAPTSIKSRVQHLQERLHGAPSGRVLACDWARCRQGLPDLWLCLEDACGHVGCGRRQEGQHALQHFQQSGHTIVIKISSYAMWCYTCQKWLESTDGPPYEQALVTEIVSDVTGGPDVGRILKHQSEDRNAAHGLRRHAIFFLVPAAWDSDWRAFMMGDSSIPPPPLQQAQAALRELVANPAAHVRYDEQYRLVTDATWQYLRERYGATPALPAAQVCHLVVLFEIALIRSHLPT